MNDEKWPLPDPRVAGLREHHERIKLLLRLASQAGDSDEKFRLMMAAIYSAQAIVELHYEAAEKEQLPSTRNDVENTLMSRLPWFNLIEKIRIHDFHRFGLLPPNPKITTMFLGGPVKSRAQKGEAIYIIQSDGPKSFVSGESKVNEQRPLLSRDGNFFDEETKQFVPLARIISDFVDALPSVIDDFAKEILP